MTRRERIESRLQKRREWAESRQEKAESLQKQNDHFRGDLAFATQPGHIPERARFIKREEKSFEHMNMAEHHIGKAAGLEHQLSHSIFSDDDNAIEAIEAKIAKLQETNTKIKTINKLVRKQDRAGLLALGLSEARVDALFVPDFCGVIGFPSYMLTNNSANVRRLKGRIEEIKRRNEMMERTEAAGGVLLEDVNQYVRVVFSEKPDRDILNDLRAANFQWGQGHWFGLRSALPQSVIDLAPAAVTE